MSAHQAEQLENRATAYSLGTYVGAAAIAAVWMEDWMPDWFKIGATGLIGAASVTSFLLASERFHEADAIATGSQYSGQGNRTTIYNPADLA